MLKTLEELKNNKFWGNVIVYSIRDGKLKQPSEITIPVEESQS